MKRVMKAVLVLMAILTVAYVGVVVYANTDSDYQVCSNRYVLYGAGRYEGDIPPTEWYMPEQLGIYDVIEYTVNSSWVHIAVDREKEPFSLQEKQPIFLYKDRYYQVWQMWVTPALTSNGKQWQISIGAVLGAGWVFTGILFLNWRKKE